jgi:hypothetical protein
VDTGRRWWHGIGVTAIGAVLLAVSIPLLVVTLDDPDFPGNPLQGALLGLGAALFVIGLIRLGQSFLRPDERFDVHEHGFAHVTRRRTRPVKWNQVVGLRQTGDPLSGGLRGSLGVNYTCVVKVQDGSRVKFNTLTEYADELARTIDQNRTAHRS